MVADLEVAHTVADLFDDACALVSENAREREGDEALARTEVGVTQAGGNNPDEHLTALRALDLDFFQDERFVIGGQDRRGGRRHVSSPLCEVNARVYTRP